MEPVKMKSCGNKPTKTVMFLQKQPVRQDGGKSGKSMCENDSLLKSKVMNYKRIQLNFYNI